MSGPVVTNEEAIRAAYAAFNRRDLDGFLEHMDRDIRWYTLDMTLTPQGYRGHDEVRMFLRSIIGELDVFTADPEEIVENGNRLAVQICHRGRKLPDTPETSYRVAHLWSFRDGVAVRHRLYLTMERACEALHRSVARAA